MTASETTLPAPPSNRIDRAQQRRSILSDDANDRGGIQVIARAAAILRALEGQPNGLTLGELATRVSLARSTVQRIVKALLDERLLMTAGPMAGVTLGPMLVRLAAGVTIDVVHIVRPYIELLSRQLDETVDLSMIDDDSALFIDQVVGSQRLAAVSRIGERFPLHGAANGKALLAAARAQQPTLAENHLRRADPTATAAAHGLLARELDDIQHSLIAFDKDEHTVGVSAVGTWFRDAAGTPYALSIPVPSVRFDGGRRLIEPLLATRRQIVTALASEDPAA